ncbi:hypothetical protein ES708_30475 [subsurface metagenome]
MTAPRRKERAMAWILAALEGVANVMEIITFVEFIEEEAIQSASLGIFLAIRQKNNKAAYRGMNLLAYRLIPNLRAINDYGGWIAPYSKQCFEDFIAATEANLEVYKDLTLAGRT